MKTNVMRVLDSKRLPYKQHAYDSRFVNGEQVARALGQNPAQVFKTLVTMGKTGAYYVFMVPVAKELDLKKAAAAVGEKAVEMIAQKHLLPLTGYVHGGCSPIGMKKQFQTTIDQSAAAFPAIVFSAGKVGYQVELSPQALETAIPIQFADLVQG